MAGVQAASEQDPNAGMPEIKYSADPVDWNEYNGRWEQLWSLGLQPGQVRVRVGVRDR